ncbi:MAG: radical SAM protein [Candidatus Omnitrophota bacterium]
MKILLINPSSELNIEAKKYSRFVSPLPPSGIAYIAAVLEANGFEVFIEDQFASKISNKQLIDKIKYLSPQIIGFSCLTTAMSNVSLLIKEIRELDKEIRIVLGNIHATLFTKEVLEQGLADIVVRREGEFSTLEAVSALSNKTALESVKGISFKKNGNIIHNPDRELIEDLSVLPYPAWHLFDLKLYTNFPVIGVYNEIILPIQASRGCPYRCYFCSQDKIYPVSRYRKIKEVVDEIEFLCGKFNVKHFGFNDAYFPFSIDHGMEFCDEIIRRKLHKKIRWITETRVDKVNFELLKRMKEAGLRLLLYGFESGNQKILDGINKTTTIEQARQAAKMTKEAGIFISGLFILGLPGETHQTCLDTIRFAKELDPEIAKFNIAVPFPGSRFFDDYKNRISGSVEFRKFSSWYDFYSSKGNLIYCPDSIDSEELRDLQRKAMFEFYLRPVKIWRHLINPIFPLRDLFYGFYVLVDNYSRFLFNKLSSAFRRCSFKKTEQ